MKKADVLHLLGWYFPDSVGGTEVYVRSLTKELARRGHHIAIAAPSSDEMTHEYEYDGITVYRYPVSVRPGIGEVRQEEPPAFLNEFQGLISRVKPGLVHIHSLTRGVGSYHIEQIRALNIPIVFTAHLPGTTCARGTLMRWGTVPCDGLMDVKRCASCVLDQKGVPRFLASFLGMLPMGFAEFASRFPSRFATALGMSSVIQRRKDGVLKDLGVFAAVVAVAGWLEEVLKKNGVPGDKLFLSPHGLDLENFTADLSNKSRQDGEKLRVGYLGRLSQIKGVHILVQAVCLLPVSAPVELKIFGSINDDESREYYESLVKLARGDKRIVFCGEAPTGELSRVFSEIDILAVPSIWMETGPLVVLEAFAYGVPVMGSDLGGISEKITHGVNGLLVEAGDVDEWSRALAGLSEDSELINRLKCDPAKIRSVKDVASEMEAIYKKLI